MGTYICCDIYAELETTSAIGEEEKRQLGQTLVAVLDGYQDLQTIRSLIVGHCVGSVVIRCSDVPDLAHIAACTLQLQRFAKDAGHKQPLTIGLTESGGLYDLLPFGLRTNFPLPLSLAAGRTINRTFEIGQAIGKELACIGINWVFTPTLDLLSDVVEPLDASQTFGSNPQTATDHALALIQGLASQGVSASSNAHPTGQVSEIFSSPSSADLVDDVHEQSDLPHFVPIATILANNPHSSMQFGASINDFPQPEQSAHAIRTACTFILRNKCNYHGPTVSQFADPSDESFVCDRHSPLLTALAGLDMIKLPKVSAACEASIVILEAAMTTGVLPPGLIPAASARVHRFKTHNLSWETALSPRQPSIVLQSTHAALARQAHRASITAINPGLSPLNSLGPTSVILLLTPTVPRRRPNSPSDPFEPLGRALSSSFSRLRHVPYTLSAGLTGFHYPFIQRAAAVLLVLCNISSALVESQDEVVGTVRNTLRARDAAPGQPRVRKVVIGAGDPRDLRDNFDGWWGICCYEYSRGALEAAAEVILGQSEALGTLPA